VAHRGKLDEISPVLTTTAVKSGERFASADDHRRQIR
jgi:hypothetical protein